MNQATARQSNDAARGQQNEKTMTQPRLIISTARMTIPAPPAHARPRRRPLNQRLILAVIGLVIVLLALSGWAAQALRLAR
jgi:hypothetical protein